MSSYTSFPAPTMSSDTTTKPIHSLIVDTGPLIKNDPAISTLLTKAEALYAIPAVLAEIRDPETRSRVDTTLVPFLKLRNPRSDSVKFVSDFARKTGDLEVLSKPDIHLIALVYEIQCERDGGDWRLRRDPGQKDPNGPKPESRSEEDDKSSRSTVVEPTTPTKEAKDPMFAANNSQDLTEEEMEEQLRDLSLQPVQPPMSPGMLEDIPEVSEEEEEEHMEDSETESDSEGWITPSNVHRHIDADKKKANPETSISEPLEAALLTSDYAMQNVALRIGLSLLSPSMSRITELKTWVLRCHGCFAITRTMGKQFCPRCGQATLLRTSCSTDEQGQFRIHLKRNFQWNNRGNVYSVPKPTHGTANGKNRGQGGGKNGWGQNLILAEDQKEYSRAQEQKMRDRKKDLMDDDLLPGIVSGDRKTGSGRIKIGAGKGINGKKRR